MKSCAMLLVISGSPWHSFHFIKLIATMMIHFAVKRLYFLSSLVTHVSGFHFILFPLIWVSSFLNQSQVCHLTPSSPNNGLPTRTLLPLSHFFFAFSPTFLIVLSLLLINLTGLFSSSIFNWELMMDHLPCRSYGRKGSHSLTGCPY